jgi:two-component system, sensor histidine kinase and response regulator
VADTGIGIPPDKISRLFKAFSQVDASTTRKYGGTGLGLVICEKLVHLMGGSIQVKSREGEGTVFHFSIRAMVPVETTRHAKVEEYSSALGKLAPGPNRKQLDPAFALGNPLRILIAEDNLVNVKLVEHILGKLGYTPHKASNGQEAVDMHLLNHYDLILMDLSMPDLDGLQATSIIRSQQCPQPVIIAMTANAMEGDKQTCLDAGMNDYIAKPLQIDTLLGCLKKWSTVK